ncbi:hypothetical protein BT96DRAFT_28448 [Gymnopus androsaceus JB14]|uniref:Uncharacterized protein n=1 Tax=Gymnopus androsaceus JB14 TaxID=1447944 RepID=A0A6A4II30_9AGAR|nr:hypothetical protein BT96DRAFT_28448 [Gymnopus androsaceus JB14]
MLHVAAQSSGGDMIKFLLEKGADVEALDGEDLTAFHLAVRAGNVPAAKVLLTHKDVHPSRAAKNGQTPLQLAIKSKNLDMISLVVKDATVHDVRRCWDMNDVSDAVREILKTKRGFLESLNSEPVQAKHSKGAQRKVTEARAQREKAARIAEEERRAEINRQKKLEKEESRRIREAEEQERRRKAEEEQAMQRWSRNQEQIRRRAEEEARQAAEEKRKKEIESRHLVEQRAAEERRLAEQEKMRAEQEQRKQRMEQEMRQKATERQAEERRAQAQRKQRRLAEESARRAQELQRKDAERQRKLEEEERRQQEKEQQERAEQLRLREEADQRRLAAGAQKQQQRAEQRRKGGVAASHQPREHTLAPHPSEPADKLSRKSKSKRYTPHEMPQNLTEEQKIRWEVREARRAAQSARDRARAAELKLASSVQQQQHDPALFQPSPIQQGWTLQPEAIQTGPTVDDLFDPPRRKKQTASASDDSGIVITDSPEPPALQIKPTYVS